MNHRHEFHLIRTFIGQRTGVRFFVAQCMCGAKETISR